MICENMAFVQTTQKMQNGTACLPRLPHVKSELCALVFTRCALCGDDGSFATEWVRAAHVSISIWLPCALCTSEKHSNDFAIDICHNRFWNRISAAIMNDFKFEPLWPTITWNTRKWQLLSTVHINLLPFASIQWTIFFDFLWIDCDWLSFDRTCVQLN